MNRPGNEPQREYTEGEQHDSLIARRMRAFADRSREPGDAVTWTVVLGAVMSTLLIICYSVAGQPLMAIGAVALLLIWIIVVGRLGRVNVASILWGAATTDFEIPPNERAIFQGTIALSAISIIAVVVDAATGREFGWYGIALVVTVAVFAIVYLRSRVPRPR